MQGIKTFARRKKLLVWCCSYDVMIAEEVKLLDVAILSIILLINYILMRDKLDDFAKILYVLRAIFQVHIDLL